MVHRPADSRLLTNLLTHEKDYSKALTALSDSVQASLASFSAYASASAPPASHAIVAVAGSFASADEALRKYAAAVDEWRELLRMLKDAEDEVGNIMRDREILVTRLIKASKQQKPSRDSINASFPNSPYSSGSKLNLAQTELQACEAQLAEKERELQQMRIDAITGGLKGRCKALIECGWGWGEAGREGLRALDETNMQNGLAPYLTSQFHKPLPDPDSMHERPSSDLSSSIAPSQSASQIALPVLPNADDGETTLRKAYRRLSIPPAHLISEQFVPPSIQRRITEEDEDAGGSSEEQESEEAHRHIEVHENKPFGKKSGTGLMPVLRDTESRLRPGNLTLPLPRANGTTRSDLGPRGAEREFKRERKKSNLFGTLAGFFHMPMRSTGSSTSSVQGSPSTPKGRWATRTNRNLSRTGGDDSSEDERRGMPDTPIDYETLRRKSIVEAKPLPSTERDGSATPTGTGTGKRLRKASSRKRGSAMSTAAGANAMPRVAAKEDGWASDGLLVGAVGSVKAKGKKKTNGSEGLSRSGTMQSVKSSASSKTVGGTAGVKRRESLIKASLPAELSAVTAPVRPSVVRSATAHHTDPPKRAASVDYAPRTAVTMTAVSDKRRSDTWSDNGAGVAASKQHASTRSHPHSHAHSVDATRGQASLMSIVEGVTRQNRQGWRQANPNDLLLDVKAPRGITDHNTPTSSATERQTLAPTPRTQVYRPSDSRRLSSTSEPSLPLNMALSVPAAVVQKKPLKSAMRNRTPSPNPPTPPSPSRSSTPVNGQNHSALAPGAVRSHMMPMLPTGLVKNDDDGDDVTTTQFVGQNYGTSASGAMRSHMMPMLQTGSFKNGDDDAASTTSSYETGIETFEEPVEDIPPTPPPHDDDKRLGGIAPEHAVGQLRMGAGSELSYSSGSTSTAMAGAPGRRKSVRVSPYPTFSPTPPALEDDEGDHEPWGPSSSSAVRESESWQTRVGQTNVGWDDSSDEDEEYSRARRMLSKAAKRLEKAAHLK